MDRRSFLASSGVAATTVFLAGCNGNQQSSETETQPKDLLDSGAVRIEGQSVDNPQDEQGNVEYYRAVASVVNESGATIPYMAATMEFRDCGGSVLETGTGAAVGVPDELRWGFIAEYTGDQPGDVATAAVTDVSGYDNLDVEDYQQTGAVTVSDVQAGTNEDTNEVTVSGTIENTSGDVLEPVQVFVNLWAAEDRVIGSTAARMESLDQGDTWEWRATHRFSPHSGDLLPVVTEQNDPTIPFVTGTTPFELG